MLSPFKWIGHLFLLSSALDVLMRPAPGRVWSDQWRKNCCFGRLFYVRFNLYEWHYKVVSQSTLFDFLEDGNSSVQLDSSQPPEGHGPSLSDIRIFDLYRVVPFLDTFDLPPPRLRLPSIWRAISHLSISSWALNSCRDWGWTNRSPLFVISSAFRDSSWKMFRNCFSARRLTNCNEL